MQTEVDARHIGERVKEFNTFIQHARGLDSVAFEHRLLCCRINLDCEFGCVNLDMFATHTRQFSYLHPYYFGALGEKLEHVRVDPPREVWRPKHQQHHRTRQSDFDWLACRSASVGEFLAHHRAQPPQPASYGQSE